MDEYQKLSAGINNGQEWPWIEQPVDLHKESNLPKISIIIPSFNQGIYIEETILSVIRQNYSNYELIIIDGGSNDDTVKVIEKYNYCISYWVSEEDNGQSHAIQKGLNKVTGDIVNWLNSDDILAPGAFYHIAAGFNLNQYDAFCGKCDYFLNRLTNISLHGVRMGLGSSVGDTLAGATINQPSTFFKASILKELGINEAFRYTMDVDLWYRYLLLYGQHRVCLSNVLLTYFRLHENSKSVAESSGFDDEVWMVYYNVLFSSSNYNVLLEFARQKIKIFSDFIPIYYRIKIPVADIHPFLRHIALLALHEYDLKGNSLAARKCLHIAMANGQPLNMSTIRQFIKHYVLPKKWQSLLFRNMHS